MVHWRAIVMNFTQNTEKSWLAERHAAFDTGVDVNLVDIQQQAEQHPR